MRIPLRPDGLARAIFFVLLPPAAVGGGLALAPLLAAAGAASFRPSMLRQAIENKAPVLVALLAFGAWAVLSTAWSAHPDHSQALRFALTVGLGVLFVGAAAGDAAAQRLTRAAAWAAFLVLAGLLAIEATWNFPFNRATQPDLADWVLERNPARGAVILLAMSWGLAGAGLFWGGRWRWAIALAALALGGFFSTQFTQAANIAAYIIGLLAFALGLAAPRLAPLLICGVLAAWMLAAPFVTPLVFKDQAFVDRLPYSVAARVGIWDYVCAQILENPVIGHGLDASRAVTDTISVRGAQMRGVSLHPHSASLQIWFETGGIGAVLAGAVLLLGGAWLSRRFADNRAAAAAACASLAALGLIANVSYGIWQEWWNATMLLSAAVVGAIGARAARP